MKLKLLLVTGALLFLGSACSAPQPAPEPAPTPQPEFRPTSTIKDLMDSIIDPGADELWEAVSTRVDASGIHETFPRNDEEWKAVRRSAIRLIEGSNLLLMPGRHVANPGEKSENPGIELEPQEMEELINKDKQTFYKSAGVLHDAATVSLKAIDAKDKEALLDSGDAIDRACEGCHVKYWYPNEVQNQQQRDVIALPAQEPQKK